MPKPIQWPEPVADPKVQVGRSLLEAYFGVVQMGHGCACPELWDDVAQFAAMMYTQGTVEGKETMMADLKSLNQSGRV
jgi:hypothetical protein